MLPGTLTDRFQFLPPPLDVFRGIHDVRLLRNRFANADRFTFLVDKSNRFAGLPNLTGKFVIDHDVRHGMLPRQRASSIPCASWSSGLKGLCQPRPKAWE